MHPSTSQNVKVQIFCPVLKNFCRKHGNKNTWIVLKIIVNLMWIYFILSPTLWDINCYYLQRFFSSLEMGIKRESIYFFNVKRDKITWIQQLRQLPISMFLFYFLLRQCWFLYLYEEYLNCSFFKEACISSVE